MSVERQRKSSQKAPKVFLDKNISDNYNIEKMARRIIA
ncbi:hypothetical protein BREVNS_1400 [Brevinematales bacterium NS]|nr:hypothetical protein BREVNS_1400 [Brevinematales bacterium NS]